MSAAGMECRSPADFVPEGFEAAAIKCLTFAMTILPREPRFRPKWLIPRNALRSMRRYNDLAR